MKKILFILFSVLFLISCESDREPNSYSQYNVHKDECIDIINECDSYIRYYKINLEGHDYYFRKWATRMGVGSDLVHNPNCKCFKKDSIN